MTKIVIPGQNEPISIGGGPVNPIWYEKLRFLETLQPLSDIVFPAPPAGGVTSIDTATGDITFGYGLARTSQAMRASLTSAFAALGADVALNNTGNYFTGPDLGVLAAGTWLVIANCLCLDTAAGATINLKLWDGTTVMSSSAIRVNTTLIGNSTSLVGIITNPAGAVRLSANSTATTSIMKFNSSGNSKDSHIAAVRIA